MDIDDIDGIQENPKGSTYVQGIASLVAIPLLFVVLSCMCAPLWAMCRCCKCCCCKNKEPKSDITSCQIYAPYSLVLTCALAIITMAAMGYGANKDFSGALLFDTGEGEDGNLHEVVETLVSRTSSKMGNISRITLDLREGMQTAVSGVQEALNDTSILSEGTSSLISALDTISNEWSGHVVEVTSDWDGERYNFSCEFCTTIGDAVEDIKVEIDDQIGPVMDDLNDTVTEIGSSLVDVEDVILNQTDFFIENINEVEGKLMTVEVEMESGFATRDHLEEYNGHRELAYNVVFAVPLIAVIYLLFGGVLKKPMCFTLAYCYLWFSCTLMWALLAVHLPIAVLLHDSCDFLEVVDQNVTGTIGGTPGEVFEACLTGEPLADTLGLSAFLNFTEEITFPSFANLSNDFQFDQLSTLEVDANSTSFTTFYGKGDDALLTINSYTAASDFADGYVWTRDNISAFDSTVYYPLNDAEDIATRATLDDLQGVLMAEEESISAFNETLSDIRYDLYAVNVQSEELEQSVQALANNMDEASDLLIPLFDSVHDMEEAAECAFVGDAYHDTKAVMCAAVLGSLSRIVVAMFVIAILSMLSCMWSIQLVRRVEWWQTQKRQEREDKLQQSMQPKKPSIILMRQPHGYQQPGYPYNGPQI